MKNSVKKTKTSKVVNRPMAGSQPELSAKVGGVSNTTMNPSAKKSGRYGSVSR